MAVGTCLLLVKKDTGYNPNDSEQKDTEVKQKDNKVEEDNNQESTKYISEDNENNIEVIKLTQNNQEIEFNKQIIQLKIDESNIYLNNKAISKNNGYDNINIIIDDKYIMLFWPGAQAGNYILGYINEDLEYIESDKWFDDSVIAVNNLHYYNDILYGQIIMRGKYNNELNEYNISTKNIEFVYENKKLRFNETINIYELNENEQSLTFNGNKVYLKLVSIDDIHSDLYINDKKLVTINYDPIIVYVMDKYMIIASGNQCGEHILGYINENLDYADMEISIYDTDYEAGIYQEKDKIIANEAINDVELCGGRKKIEFVYENGKVDVKEVK